MSHLSVDPMRIEDYYFPVNHSQVKNLVGQMLTHIEALNLPEKAEQANKSIVNQTIYRWWEFAQENSLTSWKACIGPIRVDETKARELSNGDSDKEWKDRHAYVWLTNVGVVEPFEELPQPQNAHIR